jgi:hypothetical protein
MTLRNKKIALKYVNTLDATMLATDWLVFAEETFALPCATSSRTCCVVRPWYVVMDTS